MPCIDVVDSTWFAARPGVVAALVADAGNWRKWWPELVLEVDEWRGNKGVRWHVPAVRGGGRGMGHGMGRGMSGSAEVWLEPMFDGVVVHFFLRLDPAPGTVLPERRCRRIADRYRRRTKAALWALADELDTGRVARLTSATPPAARR